MITVQQLLQLDSFADLTILTHSPLSLTNSLTYAVMTEVPDVAQFVTQGNIIVTTAMIFKENENEWAPFLHALHDAKISALAIKPSRFIERIPPSVIQLADQLSIAIIQVPKDRVLISLVEDMNNVLVRNDSLLFAIQTQQRFSKLLFRNYPLQNFVEELSQMTQQDILLLDTFFDRVACSPKVTDSLYQTIYHALKEAKAEQFTTRQVLYYQDEKSFLVLPLKIFDYYHYYLIIRRPSRILMPVTNFTIDQASLILSFAIYKQIKMTELEDTMHFQSLAPWFKGESTEGLPVPEALIPSHYFQVILIYHNSKTKMTTATFQDETRLVVFNWLKERISQKIPGAQLYLATNREILLLLTQAPTQLTNILTDIAKQLHDIRPLSIHFYIGEAVAKASHLAYSYQQARALHQHDLSDHDDCIHMSEDTGYRGLMHDVNPTQIHHYCQNILRNLAFPTDDNERELRQTLEVYYACNKEALKTAEKLHLHRNSVKYRLNKIEDLLGYSLNDPENELDIRLALALSQRTLI